MSIDKSELEKIVGFWASSPPASFTKDVCLKLSIEHPKLFLSMITHLPTRLEEKLTPPEEKQMLTMPRSLDISSQGQMYHLTLSEVDMICSCKRAGNKIQAIKDFRAGRGSTPHN